MPALPATILYLDQFAISNLTHVREDSGKPKDEFWVNVNDRINSLLTMRKLACPVSLNHQLESSLSKSFAIFKKTASALSGGWSFVSFQDVQRHQLWTCLRATRTKTDLPTWRSQAAQVLSCAPFWEYSEEQLQHLRQVRDGSGSEVENILKTSKSSPQKSIEQLYKEEFSALLKGCPQWLLNNVPDDLREESLRFLEGPFSHQLPFLNTDAWMLATHLSKSNGQMNFSSRSLLADNQFIASLSPYCDAMLIDNGCRAIWSELNKAGRVTLPTRMFSQNDKPAFLEFLDNLIVMPTEFSA